MSITRISIRRRASKALTSPKHDLPGYSAPRAPALEARRARKAPDAQRQPRSLRAKCLIALSLILGPLALAPFSAMVTHGALAEPSGEIDAVLVPGAALRNGGDSLSDALRWRMDTAIDLLKQRKAHFLVVSGGGEGDWNEARAMARYAIEAGIPESAILIEDQAATTRETGVYASRLMRRHGLSNALVVSQWYHVPRVRIALEQEGISAQGKAAKHPNFLNNEPYFVLREALALYAYGSRLDLNQRLRQLGTSS